MPVSAQINIHVTGAQDIRVLDRPANYAGCQVMLGSVLIMLDPAAEEGLTQALLAHQFPRDASFGPRVAVDNTRGTP